MGLGQGNEAGFGKEGFLKIGESVSGCGVKEVGVRWTDLSFPAGAKRPGTQHSLPRGYFTPSAA